MEIELSYTEGHGEETESHGGEIRDWLTGDWGFCHELHEFYELFGYKGIAILSDSQANNKSPISSLQSPISNLYDIVTPNRTSTGMTDE